MNEIDKENVLAVRQRRKVCEILTDEEIKHTFDVLNDHVLPSSWSSSSDDEKFISYPLFLKAKKRVCSKAQSFFIPTTFAKLCRIDKFSRMKISDFYMYVTKMTWLNRTRVELTKFDEAGKGYLVECELENYIKSQIPFLHQVKNIERWFIPFYLCTVSRRFFFFLDPIRVGRVRICDILASGMLETLRDLDSTTEPQSTDNVFSLSSVRRVYDSYVELDRDKDGSLSREELIRMPTEIGHISRLFVDFFFATHSSRNGVIDYRTYMDLVLALEYRDSPQSIRYLFNAFDIEGHGKLKIARIEALFNESDPDSGSKDFHDFYSFICDKFRMKDPKYITLDELLTS
ncbi:hypothetical protein Aperf_G00000051650 [Anoplocephala perfoliata]